MVKYVLLLIIGLLLVAACSPAEPVAKECSTNSDCVPAACCHPDACVVASNAPDCRDSYCTMECRAGTLDCGAGSCACVDGKCSVEWK